MIEKRDLSPDFSGFLSPSEIESAYRRVLSRPADRSGIEAYVGKPISAQELECILTGSEEHRKLMARAVDALKEPRTFPRYLIFGAYGNGNLGDAIQAASLLNCIKQVVPDAQVWATTAFKGPYDFAEGRKLPVGTIYDTALLSRFDALFIGGGGLLAHPHEPLQDSSWAASLPIATALIAVGASPPFASDARAIIERAAWASGRDAKSLGVLSTFRRDVHFMPDPVLVDAELTKGIGAQSPLYETCWVLRGPVDENHAFAASLIGSRDLVVGLEPREDEALKSMFPNILLVSSLEEFAGLAVRSRRVVSMRLHGLILGLRYGRPSYSVRLPKGASLFEMLGLSPHAFATMKELRFTDKYNLNAFERQLPFFQELFRSAMRNVLDVVTPHDKQSVPFVASPSPEPLMITREEVICAYRFLLGREPESEVSISSKMSAATWANLRDLFVQSEEYQIKKGAVIVDAEVDYLTSAPNEVDVEVSNQDFARLMDHVQGAWEALGADRPHWSVITNPKFLPNNIAANLDTFYDSGANNLDCMERAAARAGRFLPTDGTVFELGCGAGRVTAHLAKRFRHVIASDISRPHLEIARDRLACEPNINFVHFNTLDALEVMKPFDCFYSVIVLQHNPPPLIYRILQVMLSKVRENGCVYFQVPVARSNYCFRLKEYLEVVKQGEGTMEMHVLPQKFLFPLLDDQGFRLLDVQRDNGPGREFHSLTIFAEKKVR